MGITLVNCSKRYVACVLSLIRELKSTAGIWPYNERLPLLTVRKLLNFSHDVFCRCHGLFFFTRQGMRDLKYVPNPLRKVQKFS